jgi:HNH endonuclease
MAHAPGATHAPSGSILSVGRKTRTISPALRRALEFRDRGCRFPGCGLRFTDAHHIKHWADGGETSLGNCLLLCSHHHRLIHEGGWKVRWWGEGNPCFFDTRGGTHFDGRWRTPGLGERPIEVMIEANLRGGPTAGRPPPDASTAGALWKRENDIPDDVNFRAMEAIG